MDLADYNAPHYFERAKKGYVRAIPKLFYSLSNSVDEETIGTHTKEVMIEILTTVATTPKVAQKVTGISLGDSSQLIELLKDEVISDTLTPVSKYLLKELFKNLAMNKALAKKAIGIKSGRPPDPMKHAADVRLATLVLYYYEKTGVLISNRERSGAFFLAAAHAYKIEEPTDEQETKARHSWNKHKEEARREWKSICDAYAQSGCTPVPKDDYMLSSMLDDYVG